MASKLCWCVNTKKALQTILSHLFTQWQFPCSLNRYDFLFRIYAGFSGSRDYILLQYVIVAIHQRFLTFCWLLMLWRVCINRKNKKEMEPRLLVLFYIHMIEAQLRTHVKTFGMFGYYQIVRPNLLSMSMRKIRHHFQSDLLRLLRVYFFSVQFPFLLLAIGIRKHRTDTKVYYKNCNGFVMSLL